LLQYGQLFKGTAVLLLCRWIKDQDEKLPEETDKDNIETLKEKEGKIAVSCKNLNCRTSKEDQKIRKHVL